MVESKAHVAGHPIHPMVVMFPVALFPIAIIFDLVWLAFGDPIWLAVASWALLAAVVTAVGAAVPGLVDYFAVVPSSGPARRTANHHMWNGFAIMAIGALSALLRFREGAYGPLESVANVGVTAVYGAIFLNAVVNLLIIAQGWWGGELVYRHLIGVNPESERDAARERPDRGDVRRTGGGRE